MAANKKQNFPPVALTASAANLLNCNITSLAGPVGFTMAQPYLLINHIRVVNKTAASHNFSFYKGATGGSAAGTEVVGTGKVVAANDVYDYYGLIRLDAADFLTGLADAVTSLTVSFEGEIGISG